MISKIPAIVIYNNQEDDTIPYPGCFKVACPEIYGYESSVIDELPPSDLIKLSVESPWVIPSNRHPLDFYLPEIGEGVFISFIKGDVNLPVEDGYYPSELFENLMFTTDNKRDGYSQQIIKDTDRIIATRNGSYIKIEDDIEGMITLEVYGKSIDKEGDNSTRVGSKIILDPKTDSEKISLIANNKDESKQVILNIDTTKDDERLSAITPTGFKFDISEKDKSIKSETPNGNILEIEDNNDTVTITQKDGTTIEFGENITITSSKDLDINGDNITVNGSKVVITGGELDVSGSSAPTGSGAFCGIPNCLFTGAPHVGDKINGT